MRGIVDDFSIKRPIRAIDQDYSDDNKAAPNVDHHPDHERDARGYIIGIEVDILSWVIDRRLLARIHKGSRDLREDERTEPISAKADACNHTALRG